MTRDRYEEEPLIENEEHEEKYNWNLFKNTPRETVSGSLEQSKYIDGSIKFLKITTIIVTFLVVLLTAVVSKGSLLFMTSQIRPNITRLYCNKYLDNRQQYIVNHPVEERTVWIWLIIFSYLVPEMGTFFRSLRIVCFKSWKYPTVFEFIMLALTEILPAIGSCLLVFIVFPELDVIKAAMLTNGICLVPGFVAFISRKPSKVRHTLSLTLDIVAIGMQVTALLAWPIVEEKPILYIIPVSLCLISIGWWENFASEKSIFPWIGKLAKDKKEFKNDFYFMYAIITPLKCLIFFVTVLVIIWIREGDVTFMFDRFWDAFNDHAFNVTQIEPIVGTSHVNYNDAVSSITSVTMETSFWTPLLVFLLNIATTYMCYAFCKFACKIMIQSLSFALPITLTVPVLLTALVSLCGMYNESECAYADSIPLYLFWETPPLTYLEDFVGHQHAWIWLVWLLSQSWITIHIWANDHDKLMSTEKLFFKPMYDAFLIDQSVAMNRRREQLSFIKLVDAHDPEDLNIEKDKVTKIYACGTMWHETKEEMVEFLKSVLRLDEDQCAHRIVREYLQYNMPNYYEFETHIFFDDAFIRTSQDDPDPHVNQYVLDLIDSVSEAASNVHEINVQIKPPIIYSTPYGGRLVWMLPGKTKMIAHLKDKAKIRPKKRWSQVMYMYYLLGYRIMDNDQNSAPMIKNMAKNTYILALDGDIDFQPEAVHLLVDYMKKNQSLGAACGRIHPVGSGAMAWYQIFEYAVGHWLQKATEHVIGCVLCSPGCFSLFRAAALMDDNVMAKYTTEASEARHYVQYDQGEDRWLCTLLLQRGYRVEYSAASDAYTHCPEGFNEFYNQRRRWMPSTTANIMDLLTDYKHIIKINDNISIFYILYQVVLMIGTVIGPGTIFLMLVGAFVAAFKISQYSSMVMNITPVLLFIIVCATCKSDTQLFFAGLISAVYGLVMMTVFVGIMIQIEEDGWMAPSSLFLLATAGEFIISAIMHPQEFYCLKYGIIYYVTVPSMYMLLVIYSIFNMNNVSWGTREVTVMVKPKENNKDDKGKPAPEVKPAPKPAQNGIMSFFGDKKDNTGSIEFSFGGLFKMMCCTYDGKGEEREILRNIQTSLQQVQQRLNNIERNGLNSEFMEPRKTARGTEHFIGMKAARASFRPSTIDPNVQESESYADEFEDDEESNFTPSDDVDANSWYYDGELIKSEVQYIDRVEKKFWEKFIQKYLYPLDETSKKDIVAKDLKDLRDKMVLTFFMLNALFVLVIFLLNLQQDIIHVNWPISPKVNFTYMTDENEIIIQQTYLQLQPIGFVFLISFALLMGVQFIAMFVHRFGTFCQIMSNTDIDFNIFGGDNVDNITEETLLDKDPIKIFKKLIRLQGLNEEEQQEEENVAPIGRRNTVFYAAMKREKKAKPVIDDLDEAFYKRMSLIRSGKLKETHEIVAVVPDKYQEICRTCLNKNGLINLFENKHNGLLFSDLFTMFSLLELDSTDDLPKKICDTCAQILIQFYMFKERIRQSQIILQDVLTKNTTPTKEEETEENVDYQNDDTDLDTDEIKSDCESDKSEVKLHDPSSNEIICNFCNLKFSSYPIYLTHRRKEAELRRKKEPCIICNKVISTYKLKDHLNSHTKEAPYKCEECGEKYRFRSSLYRHKFVHKAKKPHVCHICGKGFIQAPTLTDHIRTHNSEKSFICNICGKTFITKHALTNHIYMHKNDKSADLNDLNCKNCDKIFTAAHTFNRHMLTHYDKTFLCSECGKKFATKSLLKQHQKLHSEIKPYICDICNKSFAQKNSLLKHSLTHSGEKSHVCIICDKTFSQKGHLTYHMRSHSGEKPYNCSYCNKAFSHSGSYNVHIRIHTGDRPYICDVCDKGFYDSSSMKKHRKIHEGRISNNSYNKTTN